MLQGEFFSLQQDSFHAKVILTSNIGRVDPLGVSAFFAFAGALRNDRGSSMSLMKQVQDRLLSQWLPRALRTMSKSQMLRLIDLICTLNPMRGLLGVGIRQAGRPAP